MNSKRILIIDDDARLSGLFQVMLRMAGSYTTAIENRPFAAVDAVRDFNPDLILLDVDMPGRDGGAVAQEIRGDVELSDIPIIFLTSLIAPEESGLRYLGGRKTPFLSKSISPALLVNAIEEALAARESCIAAEV